MIGSKHTCPPWRWLMPTAGAFLVSTWLPAAAFAQRPVRLKLSLDSTTVEVGKSVELRVQFLDGQYSLTTNDRDRTVTLETRAASTGAAFTLLMVIATTSLSAKEPSEAMKVRL